jgi:hypothetical protein
MLYSNQQKIIILIYKRKFDRTKGAKIQIKQVFLLDRVMKQDVIIFY